MTEAIDIWREKLAGVTPGPWEADSADILGPTPYGLIHDHNRTVAANISKTMGRANAAHIVRSDRLSRILADEATVEGLARMLCARDQVDPDAMFEGHPLWTQLEDEARDVLNHLAQLALGDGT